MIVDRLAAAALYAPMHPLFPQAFQAVRNVDPASAEPGVFPIVENELILMINRLTLKRPEKARLEIHNAMIDLHVPLSGEEVFAWKPRATLTEPAEPYDERKDARHYADAADTRFALQPGQFALFFPGDAHAGCIGNGELLKIVVKIRADFPARA